MVNSINGSKKFGKSSKRKVVNPKPTDIALEACGDSSCSDYGVNLIHGLVVYHRDWTVFERRIIRTMGVVAYLSSAEFASGFDDLPNFFKPLDVDVSQKELGVKKKSKGDRKGQNERRKEKRLQKVGADHE